MIRSRPRKACTLAGGQAQAWLDWLCEASGLGDPAASSAVKKKARQAGRQDPVSICEGGGEGDPFINRSA